MSACCQLLSHLWALVAHHSKSHKVTQEEAIAAYLYPRSRRVKAEPLKKEEQ